MLITLKCVSYQFLSFTRNVGDTDVLLPIPVNFLSFSTSLASSQNYKLLLGEDKTRVVILVECSAVAIVKFITSLPQGALHSHLTWFSTFKMT